MPLKRKAKPADKPAERYSLDREIAVTQDHIASARAHRVDLLRELAGGVNVDKDLDALDAEITALEAKQKRLNDAKQVEAKANTTAARKAKHDRVLADINAGVAAAEQLGHAAQNVIKAIDALGESLSALETIRREVEARLVSAIEGSWHGAQHERHVEDRQRNIRRAIDQLTLASQICNALFDSGIGRVGAPISRDRVQVSRVPNAPLAGEQLVDGIARLKRLIAPIADWSTRANIDEEAA